MMDQKNQYTQLAGEYRIAIDKEEKILLRLSLARLLVFFVGIAMVYLAFVWNSSAGVVVTFTTISLFLYLVKKYSLHVSGRDHLLNLEKINLNELKALEGDFSMFGDGNEYGDPKHDFTYDIDIFGNDSLFQYLNRTVTSYGSDLLAGWLAHPYSVAGELEDRQNIVAELASKFGWRQEFIASGMGKSLNRSHIDSLSQWLAGNDEGKLTKLQKSLATLMPVITGLLLGFTVAGVINYSMFIGVVLLNLSIVGINLKKTNKIYEKFSGRNKYLQSLGVLLKLIENEDFASPIADSYKREISSGGSSGVHALNRLSTIIQRFDNRLNLLMAFLLNGLALWDLHCLWSLEKWKEKYRTPFPGWLEVIGIIDGYLSLANYCYNNDDFVMPVKAVGDNVLDVREMGHPLIDRSRRVCNDFLIGTKGQIIIVTGANMAGKSTFLRTVAVNMILAMIGAPVCASYMCFRPMELFTSMRTTDSLHSNESYFYAELKRLKTLGSRLEARGDLLFILDEILKGTNSEDKRMGSRLFLMRIISLKGTGLIATHDTSLGDMENDYPAIITNKCIEIEVDGTEIKFDYKLNSGIARNKNAVLLMQQLGIIEG